MPKVSQDTNQPAPVAETVEKALANIAVSTNPVVICGVNRKVNIGNFETIDIYAGVALPLKAEVDPEDMESLKEVLERVAENGFYLVSNEANKRYSLIKDLQRGQANA